MNTTSILDTATDIIKSREFKIVLIGLQLGFLALHYLSAEREKGNTSSKGAKRKLLTLKIS
jgi:hypothetical protein